MATCLNTCGSGTMFDPNSLLLFFVALSLLSGDCDSNGGSNNLLLFFLLLALLLGTDNNTCSASTC